MSWYKKAEDEKDVDVDVDVDADEKDVEIPESSRDGDCYQVAGRYVMDHGLMGDDQNVFLVHGIVVGQGPISGLEYGHAWVEEGDECIDLSQGRNIRMPKVLYYALGNIDPSKQFRYSPEEMRRKILDVGHWGPWDLQSKY
jgi:hypothetical protein